MDQLREQFPDVPETAWPLLAEWAVQLREWNEKINLVSRKDIDALEQRHLAHCLVATRFLKLMNGTRVLDVGTGGGLPGLPLAICYPQAQFTLVDSIGKKIHVVQEIARSLKLKNVTAVQARAETIKREFDFVTGRAVTDLRAFMGWIRDRVRRGQRNSLPNGVLYWIGGDVEASFTALGIQPRFRCKVQDILPDPYFASKYIVHFDVRDLPRAKTHIPAEN